MWFNHVVNSQAIYVYFAAALKAFGSRFIDDFGHSITIFWNGWMVFIDREIFRFHLAIGKTNSISSFRRRKNDFLDTHFYCSVNNIICA